MSAWRGRVLLTIAAAAFFAGPMLGARAFENARIGAWEDRGFSRDAPRQWWSHGITHLSEALDWRASGFDPAGAGAWKRMLFVPVDAKEWGEVGFDARTAPEWRREAFDPAVAAGWRDAGFSIGDAVAWRKRAFGPADAAAWRRAGHSPIEAAEARAAGSAQQP
jgi:Ni/Co efflux regulator RcnB